MVAKSLREEVRQPNRSRRTPRRASAGRLAKRSLLATALSVATLVAFTSDAAFAACFMPSLDAASPYAILAATAGTSTGLSGVTGDLGLASSASAPSSTAMSSGLLGTGLLSGVSGLAGSLLAGVTGSTNVNDAAASVAESAASAAFRAAAGEAATKTISGGALEDATLTPGVYAVSGSLELAGRLLLDARGDKYGAFIFQIPGDLTTAPAARLVLDAGARASDVLWQVGGSTDLASATSFVGTILSTQSITLGSGSKLVGRACSLSGPVNLENDIVALPPVLASAAAAGAALPGVTGVGANTSSTSPSSASSSNALPLASLPSLLTPLAAPQTTSASAPSSGLSLPSVTLPSLPTEAGSVLSRLASAPSVTPGSGKIAHPRVKEGLKRTANSHSRGGTPIVPASSTIPTGAPQTGLGGMAGSGFLWTGVGAAALLIALCAGVLAVAERRRQRV